MSKRQTVLPVITPEQARRVWAFAAKTHTAHKRRTKCTITAVSREAKALGIRVGMAASDARAALPELRVLVYSRPRSRA